MPRRTLLLSALAAAVLVIPTWTAPVPLNRPAKEIINSIGMKLVRIEPGAFTMGSTKKEQDAGIKDYEKTAGRKASEALIAIYRAEGPQHEVEITKPFYMGVCTVTQAEFEKVTKETPSWYSAEGGGKDKVKGMDTRRFPVECVSWEDAVKFCNQLSDRENLKSAYVITKKKVSLVPGAPGYRLPTEAEWEYACRAGTKTKYHSGDAEDDLKKVGWYDANSDSRTHAVGRKKPNAWGLYDMHGNVYQWCWDWYGKDYYQNSDKKDPEGKTSGTSRVLRGGDWNNDARFCRAAFRDVYAPDRSNSIIGFRVVRVPAGK